jgi:hypothetical protein
VGTARRKMRGCIEVSIATVCVAACTANGSPKPTTPHPSPPLSLASQPSEVTGSLTLLGSIFSHDHVGDASISFVLQPSQPRPAGQLPGADVLPSVSVPVSADGSFTKRLDPGTYLAVVKTAHAGCIGPRVVVRPNQVSHTDIRC